MIILKCWKIKIFPQKKGQLFSVVCTQAFGVGRGYPLGPLEKKDPQGEEIGPSPLLNHTNPLPPRALSPVVPVLLGTAPLCLLYPNHPLAYGSLAIMSLCS